MSKGVSQVYTAIDIVHYLQNGAISNIDHMTVKLFCYCKFMTFAAFYEKSNILPSFYP